jgi:hypothetical protein
VAAGLDPIFVAHEPAEQTPRASRLLWQFFFFPLLVVVVVLVPLGVYLATHGVADSPKELLDTVLSGAENAQKQAAQQLANAIATARNEEDAAARAGKDRDPPFYAHPQFAADLRRAFLQARTQEKSEERQMWLAQALGRAADPEAVPLLLDVLYPPPDARARPSQDLRRAAAKGLLFMESRAAEGALVKASKDPDDSQIRALGMNGLALLGVKAGGAAADGAAVLPALKRGLDDEHAGVRLNAAYGLALRGDASGIDVLERSLDHASLAHLGVDPNMHQAAQANAMRGILSLASSPAATSDAALAARLQGLRGRMETLAREDGDEKVRQFAREGLDRWRKN